MRNRYVRRIAGLLAACLACLALSLPTPAPAAEAGQKVVRIGYVNVAGYEEGGEGEYKSGHGYEYFQKIAYHTGWKYRYVYGPFSELIKMLADGEIDVLGNVTDTPERARAMDFSSYPQGLENFYIYAMVGRGDLAGDNPQSLNGMRIGVGRHTYQSMLLTQFLATHGIDAKVVEFNGSGPLLDALKAGAIDAMAMTDAFSADECTALHHIGFKDFYFAVSKKRPDLLEELNSALYAIQSANPGYNATLFGRYLQRAVSQKFLSARERKWLTAHGDALTIGYLDDNMPYSGLDGQGNLTGILSTIVGQLEHSFGIRVKAVPYASVGQLLRASDSGEIDCYGPLYGDFYLTEQHSKIQTDPIMATTPLLLYGGELRTDVIAVTDRSIFPAEVVRILYPEARLLPCETMEECLNAVADGRAGCTVASSGQMNLLHRYQSMHYLSYSEILRRVELCLFTNLGQVELAGILNKATVLSSTQLKGAVFISGMHEREEISTREFIQRHAVELLSSVLLVVCILGLLIYAVMKLNGRLSLALDDAKSANASKTVFLNNMSHDIRTPMNAILGFARLIRKDRRDPEAVDGHALKIECAGDYLLSIINSVLDMARIDSGHMELHETCVDLEDPRFDLTAILHEDMRSKNLRFTFERDFQHRYVWIDVPKAGQVVENLLSNAVKYTPEGGSIRMSFNEIACELPGHATFETVVSDTGIGMAPEFLEHIFDSFSRERSTTESRIQGSGLGMSIVKKLVDFMGGRIEVESTPGKGSTFRVRTTYRIATAEDVVVPEERASSAGVDLEGRRILLAEDNDLNAEIACAILEDAGAAVDRAGNGRICVEMLEAAPEGRYDLVLMDIQMPEMNGYKATMAIRALPDSEKAAIPIVAVTANAFEEDRAQAMSCGMNGYIAKPIVIRDLMDALHSAMR